MKEATGKLGVMIVGLGAVSTTFIAGVLSARKGLTKPVGALTQYDKIRVAQAKPSATSLIQKSSHFLRSTTWSLPRGTYIPTMLSRVQ